MAKCTGSSRLWLHSTEPRSVNTHSKQPPEARRVALQHFPDVPGIFRSHDDPVPSALHVAAAPLLWPAGRDEHGFGLGYRTLAPDLESRHGKRCSTATRTIAGVCRRPDIGRAPAHGARTSG